MAAIRKFYDYLVVGQIVPSNPSLSVRGPKHRQKKGQTPVLTKEEAKTLFNSFDISTIIGLRDRALAATMFYSMGRVSVVLNMRIKDFYSVGEIYKIRLYEKGNNEHEMPVHHTLERYIKTYIEKAGMTHDKNALLFRSCGQGKANNELLEKPLSRQNAWVMIRKRVKQAGIKREICNHSFRASGITIYMENGGELHKAQEMANHASIKTTAMYDHSKDKNTIDEVERIIL